ncbi:YpmS family protein [Filibacter tadaridae]|uniref:DUF2140 family protein n=1 Tax=Filibacter tadaridae TaxID=2483811 RepID=A0A3P5X4A9_9BACL|nr:YpmS family protein [Filibacter tadaridae]VDC29004.1 hypothetical protein FILTAD_01947 [Filibacter tadaridae]
MNRWKIGFFALAGMIVAAVAYVIFLIGMPSESVPIPDTGVTSNATDNILTVRSTKKNFEGIANTYIRKAMNAEPLPVTMEIKDDIALHSELTIFTFTLPVVMHFDPVVQDNGNVILKQTSMEVGDYNIAPSVVLKILKDSIKLPPWMIVRPKEEELFIDLSAVPVSGNIQVKAKTFNLAEDEIILEIRIPNE